LSSRHPYCFARQQDSRGAARKAEKAMAGDSVSVVLITGAARMSAEPASHMGYSLARASAGDVPPQGQAIMPQIRRMLEDDQA
jgi:hypothetical protein